jgi:hypothetical protein
MYGNFQMRQLVAATSCRNGAGDFDRPLIRTIRAVSIFFQESMGSDQWFF